MTEGWPLLGIQGSNPGFLDQNQACFLYTNPHRQSGNISATPLWAYSLAR